jgi:hypothetical protein
MDRDCRSPLPDADTHSENRLLDLTDLEAGPAGSTASDAETPCNTGSVLDAPSMASDRLPVHVIFGENATSREAAFWQILSDSRRTVDSWEKNTIDDQPAQHAATNDLAIFAKPPLCQQHDPRCHHFFGADFDAAMYQPSNDSNIVDHFVVYDKAGTNMASRIIQVDNKASKWILNPQHVSMKDLIQVGSSNQYLHYRQWGFKPKKANTKKTRDALNVYYAYRRVEKVEAGGHNLDEATTFKDDSLTLYVLTPKQTPAGKRAPKRGAADCGVDENGLTIARNPAAGPDCSKDRRRIDQLQIAGEIVELFRGHGNTDASLPAGHDAQGHVFLDIAARGISRIFREMEEEKSRRMEEEHVNNESRPWLETVFRAEMAEQSEQCLAGQSDAFSAMQQKLHDHSWADWVWEADFVRPLLAELAAFSYTHKHMPGVQSAAAVARGEFETMQHLKTMLMYQELFLQCLAEHASQIAALKRQIAALKREHASQIAALKRDMLVLWQALHSTSTAETSGSTLQPNIDRIHLACQDGVSVARSDEGRGREGGGVEDVVRGVERCELDELKLTGDGKTRSEGEVLRCEALPQMAEGPKRYASEDPKKHTSEVCLTILACSAKPLTALEIGRLPTPNLRRKEVNQALYQLERQGWVVQCGKRGAKPLWETAGKSKSRCE